MVVPLPLPARGRVPGHERRAVLPPGLAREAERASPATTTRRFKAGAGRMSGNTPTSTATSSARASKSSRTTARRAPCSTRPTPSSRGRGAGAARSGCGRSAPPATRSRSSSARTSTTRRSGSRARSRRSGRKRHGGEIAVLYRTNAQSRLIEVALRAGRVPYVIVRGTSFYDRAGVEGRRHHLAACASPRSDLDLGAVKLVRRAASATRPPSGSGAYAARESRLRRPRRARRCRIRSPPPAARSPSSTRSSPARRGRPGARRGRRRAGGGAGSARHARAA